MASSEPAQAQEIPPDLGRLHLGGALNSRTGKLVHGEAFRKNSELFIAMVEAGHRACTRFRRIHLILDNFIIQELRRPLRFLAGLGDRVVVPLLPPYSPRPNVIERLWKQMHGHVTRNHKHQASDSRSPDIGGAQVVRFSAGLMPATA